MKDIKTRNRNGYAIKSIDRAQIATDKIRQANLKTKEMTKVETEQSSPSSFAEEHASNAVRDIAREGSYHAKTTIRHSSNLAKNRLKTRTAKKSYSQQKAAQATNAKVNATQRKSREKQVQKYARKRAVQGFARDNARKGSKSGTKLAKSSVKTTYRALKAIIESTKALVAGISAGGAAALVVVIICVIFGAAFYFFGDESNDTYTPVSAQVEAYTSAIQKYANEYGIGEYTELIKAVMMQESGGRGKDPMQASESGFNKKYPRKPNGITDPDYSIKCGVQALVSVLKQAKISSPVDMDNIKLALQGYNFGNGYISWAVSKYGGYSKANAEAFAKAQAKKHGWNSYGDTSYVEHVLRYYPYGNYTYDIINTGPGKLALPIKGMTSKNITSHFGPRSSPGGIGSRNHQGLDIGFPTGTKVYACESGTVTNARYLGGYGNCVIINHGGGLCTYYAHLSKIYAKKGQKVTRGQLIGAVGSTGNSTGPHLHLGVQVNGKFVNPEKGWVTLK